MTTWKQIHRFVQRLPRADDSGVIFFVTALDWLEYDELEMQDVGNWCFFVGLLPIVADTKEEVWNLLMLTKGI